MTELDPFIGFCIDRSISTGYQFEFFCPRCSTGFLSRLSTPPALGANAAGYMSSKLADHVPHFGHFAGDLAADALNDRAKDAARERAIAEVRSAFVECPWCRLWRCRAHCWNQQAGRCIDCAPINQSISAGSSPFSSQYWSPGPPNEYPSNSYYPPSPAGGQYPYPGYPAPGGYYSNAPYTSEGYPPPTPPKRKRSPLTSLGLGCLAVLLILVLCVGAGLVYENIQGNAQQPISSVRPQTPNLEPLPTIHLSCYGNAHNSIPSTTFLLVNSDPNNPIDWSTVEHPALNYTVWATVNPNFGNILAEGSETITITFASSICQQVQHAGSISYTIKVSYTTPGSTSAILYQDVDFIFSGTP